MYSCLGWPPPGMFLASLMFDDSAKSRNPAGIMCCEAVGESQRHFPEEAPHFHDMSFVFDLALELEAGANISRTRFSHKSTRAITIFVVPDPMSTAALTCSQALASAAMDQVPVAKSAKAKNHFPFHDIFIASLLLFTVSYVLHLSGLTDPILSAGPQGVASSAQNRLRPGPSHRLRPRP